MSSSIRSLGQKIKALAASEIPFDEAERLLVATQPKPEPVDTVSRARQERLEYAELLGLEDTHVLSRENRLTRWLGLDICPPSGKDEDAPSTSEARSEA